MKRTEDEYYKESKRLRAEVLAQADDLKDHPLRFIITNGITMEVEITKTEVAEGKHGESAYFAYFDRKIGVRTVLAMREDEEWWSLQAVCNY